MKRSAIWVFAIILLVFLLLSFAFIPAALDTLLAGLWIIVFISIAFEGFLLVPSFQFVDIILFTQKLE